MSRILVVDDKELMRDSVATTIARKGHTVAAVASGKAALDKLSQRSFDAVVTDLQMPEMDGLELLAEIRRVDEQLPVVFMTAYGTIETAVAALKQGAYDYITKPFSGDVLLVTVERAVEHGRLLKENQILRVRGTPGRTRVDAAGGAEHVMIGSGPLMAQLMQRLERIADSHGTVLISGESGSGKEVAARWIHEHSPRAEMPFLAINCAALSTNLLESELFGHEKGAFTGADKLRKGRFELADGGTLMLDEISEIDSGIQAKLLRVLQERNFERVGSSASRAVDVRVIVTTNRNLPAEVSGGGFRQDLYFRLNVLPVAMPPLREHTEDIEELARHFLKQVADREGRPVKELEAEALALMQRYPWPGNVRELQNICERAAVLTRDETIRASLIEPWLIGQPGAEAAATERKPAAMMELADAPTVDADRTVGVVCDGDLTLSQIERETIVATLRANGGHRQKSAKALGIGVRTLGLKLKKWKELSLVSPSL
ncbi:MAG: sigma-54-dependent Fis family transcriptional regulator [Phycisphaerales bacterium]|nr:MAG: sigma-54-dependent Fis family transcriptional regulator [Phycisphaerales bacterium]